MNYALGSSFNLGDLSDNFPSSKLKMTCDECEKLTGDRHRKKLAEKIFTTNLKMVLEDVIENNTTFQLPTGSKRADIHMYRYEDDEFIKARKNGKFEDIDYLKSFFHGYELKLFMYSNNRVRSKNIYVDKNLKDKITEKTNEGVGW